MTGTRRRNASGGLTFTLQGIANREVPGDGGIMETSCVAFSTPFTREVVYEYDAMDRLTRQTETQSVITAALTPEQQRRYAEATRKPSKFSLWTLSIFAALSLSLSLIVSAFVSPLRRKVRKGDQSRARLSSTDPLRAPRQGEVRDEEADPLVRESLLAPMHAGILSRILSSFAPLRLCVRPFRRSANTNSSRPSRLRGGFSGGLPQRSQSTQRRRRLYSGVAVFLTVCFIIGPEQVVAMHQEAIAYQMMAAAGIGQCPTGSATVSYCYDANGSLKERYEEGQLVAAYTFDAENRLVAYTPTSGDAAIYTYDADGIRNSKTVGSVSTWHLTDKNQPYAQVLTETDTATGDLLVRYVHGDDLISQHRPGTTGTRYYHYDGQMSTRALSDAATGASTEITDRYTYDAFGKDTAQVGSTANKYRYTGEYRDAILGYYYLRARYYDNAVGRFLSRDSFTGITAAPSSLNKYVYTSANPITAVDPSGMFEFSLAGLMSSVGSIATRLVGLVVPLSRTILIKRFLGGLVSAAASQYYAVQYLLPLVSSLRLLSMSLDAVSVRAATFVWGLASSVSELLVQFSYKNAVKPFLAPFALPYYAWVASDLVHLLISIMKVERDVTTITREVAETLGLPYYLELDIYIWSNIPKLLLFWVDPAGEVEALRWAIVSAKNRDFGTAGRYLQFFANAMRRYGEVRVIRTIESAS